MFELFWVPNFIALGIYFIFGTKYSWNEGIDTCFNVECAVTWPKFWFSYCSLRMVTVRYRSLLLVLTSSMKGFYGKQVPNSYIDNSHQGWINWIEIKNWVKIKAIPTNRPFEVHNLTKPWIRRTNHLGVFLKRNSWWISHSGLELNLKWTPPRVFFCQFYEIFRKAVFWILNFEFS